MSMVDLMPRTNHTTATDLTAHDLLRIYERMVLARLLNERMWLLNRQGKVSFVISGQGQEAAQVGSAYALRPGKDWVLPYYRDLGVVLSVGMTAEELMLNAFARATDPNSGGRQMTAHYGHRSHNILSQSSPTGTQVAHAVGVALALSIHNRLAGALFDDSVVWVSFGEGASSQGDVHEAMNLAAIHQLPVLFVCENNHYAISVPSHLQMATPDVARRAAGYGFPGALVDGGDPVACYQATKHAVDRARRGEGPTLLEFTVDRLTPHSTDDNDRVYRSTEELSAIRRRDCLPRYEAFLRAEGLLDDTKDRVLRSKLAEEVDRATHAAEAAPVPTVASMRDHLYAHSDAV